MSKMIIISNPMGTNHWYDIYSKRLKPMNYIQSCFYYSHSIVMYVICTEEIKNKLIRLCYIANVQCILPDKHKPFRIVFTSVKDMKRVIPELKKIFVDSIEVNEMHVEIMKKFFEEI